MRYYYIENLTISMEVKMKDEQQMVAIHIFYYPINMCQPQITEKVKKNSN